MAMTGAEKQAAFRQRQVTELARVTAERDALRRALGMRAPRRAVEDVAEAETYAGYLVKAGRAGFSDWDALVADALRKLRAEDALGLTEVPGE